MVYQDVFVRIKIQCQIYHVCWAKITEQQYAEISLNITIPNGKGYVEENEKLKGRASCNCIAYLSTKNDLIVIDVVYGCYFNLEVLFMYESIRISYEVWIPCYSSMKYFCFCLIITIFPCTIIHAVMSLQRMVRHSLFSLPQFIECNKGTLEWGKDLTKFWNSFFGVLYPLDITNLVMTVAQQL